MIRKLLYFLFLIGINSSIEAQILVQKIPDENLCEIDINFMQNGYKLAYSNMTSEDYLFKGKEEEWKTCWNKVMYDLKNFMEKNGLKLTSNTTCFNRVYFNKDGSIAAYLYHINGLSANQEQKFDETIFQFLITQKVTIKTNQNYWQYGTLKFE
jgi:hypothetical protein